MLDPVNIINIWFFRPGSANMEQSLNRIWNPLSAELSIQGQREEGSLSNPQGTTLPPAVKLPLLYYSFPGMQARYQASLSHTARMYCPYQSMKPFIHSVRLEHQKKNPKNAQIYSHKKMKQEQIVLKRSARLNIDPGRGNGGDRVTGVTGVTG